MEIKVNDKPMEVDARISVDQLLCTLGVKPTGTAVAVNDKIVKRDNWAEAELQPGDSVLIISAAYGG